MAPSEFFKMSTRTINQWQL